MARPRLLLLDEPTIGLAPAIVDTIAQIIQDIAAEGVDVMLVEQNAEMALEIATHAFILERGEIQLQGLASELARSEAVRKAYLGIRLPAARRAIPFSVVPEETMHRLEGKVAFITGGGAGIGRASALLFAQEGAQVVIAERDAAAGEETVALVHAHTGSRARLLQTDVTEPDSVEKAVSQTVAEFGRFDVLYNNAGGSTVRDSRVTDTPFEEFWSR